MTAMRTVTVWIRVPVLGVLPDDLSAILALLALILLALVSGSLVVRRMPVHRRARRAVAAGWLAAVLYAVGVWSWFFVVTLQELAFTARRGVGSIPWLWPAIALTLTVAATTIGWSQWHRLHRGGAAPFGSALAAAVATTTSGFAAAVASYALFSSWLPHLAVGGLPSRESLSIPYALALAAIGLLAGWWWRSRWGDDRPLLRAAALLTGIAACAGIVQTGIGVLYFGGELGGLAPALVVVLLVVAVAALHLGIGSDVPRRSIASLLAVGGTLTAIGGGASIGLYAAALMGWWFPGYIAGPPVTLMVAASAGLLVIGTTLLLVVDTLRTPPATADPGPPPMAVREVAA